MKSVFFLFLGYIVISFIVFFSYVTLEFVFDTKYIKYELLLKESFADSLYPYSIIIFFKFLFSKKTN